MYLILFYELSVIEIYRDVLPSLMKHSGNMGGMLLKSINSMVENPDRLQVFKNFWNMLEENFHYRISF